MNFTPHSEEELAKQQAEAGSGRMVMDPGTYPFVVQRAEDKTSRAGNPMIAMVLLVNYRGHQVPMRDWILEKFPSKLKHFCDATNKQDQYRQGSLSAAIVVNASGWVKIGTEEKPGTKNPDRMFLNNIVEDYVVPPAAGAVAPPAARPDDGEPEEEDDIPF